MAERRIIYVPGKNVKPAPEEHRSQLWRCLLEGVRRLQPEVAEAMQQAPACFQLAPWNYLLYGRHGSLKSDLPWIDRLLARDSATKEERREARSWHKTATKFMYAVGDRFHGLIKWIPDPRVKAMIADTEPYFQNHEGIADQIRNTVKQQLRAAVLNGERVLLIGHSLGSVIAYEALWQLTHEEGSPCPVDLFLTMGSPLGMRYVRKDLLGMQASPERYPHGITLWENVSAVGDLVSLDEALHDDFAPMLERKIIRAIRDHKDDIFNWFRNDAGLNVHRSFGYLVNPVIGKIVSEWWRGEQWGGAPIVIAHRGYPAKYPENTLLGYTKALAAGARLLELDVQLTRDQVPILYHDPDTLRMSGVAGPLFNLGLDEIRQLDAFFPERFGDRFKGNPIPTLSEFASLMEERRDVEVFVEIKSDSVEHFGLENTVDRVVEAISPIFEQCVVISFHDGCVEYARNAHQSRIGWVLPAWDAVTKARAYEICPEFLFVSAARVPDQAWQIWRGPWHWAVYVVNEAKQVNRYPAWGIRYVETDLIGELLAGHELKRERAVGDVDTGSS